jgi:hypothetical protein
VFITNGWSTTSSLADRFSITHPPFGNRLPLVQIWLDCVSQAFLLIPPGLVGRAANTDSRLLNQGIIVEIGKFGGYQGTVKFQ